MVSTNGILVGCRGRPASGVLAQPQYDGALVLLDYHQEGRDDYYGQPGDN
jgi:hypothetical protein